MIIAIARKTKGHYPVLISTEQADIHFRATAPTKTKYQLKSALKKNFTIQKANFLQQDYQFPLYHNSSIDIEITRVDFKQTGYYSNSIPSRHYKSGTNDLPTPKYLKKLIRHKLKSEASRKPRIRAMSAETIATVNDLRFS